MIALLQTGATGGLFAGADLGVRFATDFGDWGQLVVFAIVVLMSGANGLIQAAKKKREAKERERQMLEPKSLLAPPEAKPARARPQPQPAEREMAKPLRPIPLRPKPRPTQPPRSSPVSTSPPTADVPHIFETLAEAIREANQEKPQRMRRSKRRTSAREPAPPIAPTTTPSKKDHQTVADRHFIADHEQEHQKSSAKRLGHVAEGLVAPRSDPDATKTRKAAGLRGVDLRQAIILKEILGPPVAMRETDDYFSP